MTGTTEPRPRIYIDTNIFIYAVEGEAATAPPSRALLAALRGRPGTAVSSEITLAEVLAPPRRPDALPVAVKRRVYLDMLAWSGLVELVPVSRDILVSTADVRSTARLRLPDAIHLATAIHARCGFFVCGDDDFQSLPAAMKRIRPTTTEIDQLLRTLA
ncbi:tRNA(fMet)-specific endonuclease VapC [Rhodoplanes serenus]|uniref:Ribonuclease VapC n=1 Tax=Rhodoplanes serenus TaxID=200615 RepID=A0A3S4DGU9_9BRAD|nr:type II toxin-antitoxin system VapC family toxin [Rhodoplanes serenus]VCU10075.1 tRNA(fMet)-specific endonuclease VapC [Rhodoplanes serenus]